MSVSYEGIGQWAATFACGGVREGQVVKVSGNGTVSACEAGDRFCGTALAVSRDGTACTVALGYILALGLALMRIAKPGRSTTSKVLVKIPHFVSGFYIEVIRGTPMLVQLFIIYYIAYGPGGLSAPDFTLFGFINGKQFVPGIVALSLNSGAASRASTTARQRPAAAWE